MSPAFDLPQIYIIGFSGRPVVADSGAIAKALRGELEKMKSPGVQLLAISPLVNETDLVFADEVIGQGIPLVILLPQPVDQLAANFPGAAGIEFSRVLVQATRVEMLSPTPLGTALHLGQKLVDKADMLLALGDAAESGETGEIISYATNRGRAVICLQETAQGVERRAYQPGEGGARPVVGLDELQKALGEPPPAPQIPGDLVRYFEQCDAQATGTAPQVRRYVVNIVLANAVASMAGAVSSSFTHSAEIGTFLTVMKFGCIFLGLGIFAMLRHRQSQNLWLKLRLKAEVCRSAIATWNSRQIIEPLSIDEMPELRELIQALHYYRATQPGRVEISLEAFKADYGIRRLADQYHYFHRQAESASRISAKLTPFYWFLSASALLTSGASLVFQSIYHQHNTFGTWTNFIFNFIPIVAPALASWILAWEAIEAVSRKKFRFAEMERLMRGAMVDLVHSHSWDAVHDVVKRAEKLLLNEVLEWYSFVKYK